MNTSLLLPKLPFQIFGVILILFGFYLMVDLRPFFKPHAYTYISEQERRRRVIKSGIGSIFCTFGILLIAFTGVLQAVTLENIFSMLAIGLCFSPIIAFLVGLRRYRDLWTFTKTKDDVVFLDKDKRPKN